MTLASHYRGTDRLQHNLRPGCLASVIKGIGLGRLDYCYQLLCLTQEPGLTIQEYEAETMESHSYTREWNVLQPHWRRE